MPLYGLDREINRRLMAKYDPERERQAREWIEDVIEEKLPDGDLLDVLKDGVALCKVVDKLKPGIVKYKESKMPFKQMENIASFLSAAQKEYEMPAHDLFQTIDLYEKKNPGQVVDSIHSFTRYAQKKGWDGPILGPKLVEKQERQWSEEQLIAGRAIMNTAQYGYAGGASQGNQGISFGVSRQIVMGSSPTSSPSSRKNESSPAR